MMPIVAVAMARYSTSVENHVTVFCFFTVQTIGVLPSMRQEPVVDLRLVELLAPNGSWSRRVIG